MPEPDHGSRALRNRTPRARTRRARAVVLSGAAVAVLALAACTHSTSHGSNGPTRGPSSPPAQASSLLQPQNVFGPSSVWRQDISDAPVAANSDAMTANLVAQVKAYYGGTAAFNNGAFGIKWYNVGADQATTTVKWRNCQPHKHPGNVTPAGLLGRGGQFTNVPFPANAAPSAGSDHALTIYRASTDQLWDFWRVEHSSAGWTACWGGRIDHVSRSPGYFTGGFGADATSLAGEAGDVSITDARSGHIEHTLSLAIPSPATYTNFSWPAQRSDGVSMSSSAIPEGARLRLDPSVDVDSLHLSPVATMIAKAAQKYGFLVTNRSGAVGVGAESGTPTKDATGTSPWPKIFGATKSFKIMKDFPWQRVQVVSSSWTRAQLR